MVVIMRNVSRIPMLIKEIEDCWIRHPDWRFGQLIENIKSFSGIDDLFFIEDDEMAELFRKFSHTNENYIKEIFK